MDENEKNRQQVQEKGAVFYYNREKRLEHMPKNAALYDGSLSGSKGFFKVLTAAPGGKFLLGGIGILIAVILLISMFNKQNADTIDEIPVSVTAFLYEDSVYVTLKLAENQVHEPCSVAVNFGAIDENQVLLETKQISGSYDGSELLIRTIFTDYDVAKIAAIVTINGVEKTMSVLVDR